MFMIRNSMKNICRYWRRYTLIGMVLGVIVFIAAVLIGIFNYTSLTIEALKTKYAGVVKVSKGSIPEVNTFKEADYEVFHDLDYVERVDFLGYILSTGSMGHSKYDITEDHKRLMSPEDYEAAIHEPPVAAVDITVNGETHALSDLMPNTVYIMGYNYDKLPEDKKNRFVIESGRMYETDDECVITKNPLLPEEEWNLLGIGDTIKISKNTGASKEYTVVGILQAAETITEETKTRVLFTTFDSAAAFGRDAIDDNKSFVSSGPVNNPIDPNMGVPLSNTDMNFCVERYEVAVVLKSHEYFDAFLRYVNELDGYRGIPLYENYFSIVRVLNQSYAWSILFIVIITIILVFMTVFTTIFHLNSRKYEIAVLRSVGMKKGQLILSYLIENLTFVWGITAVALILSKMIEPIFIGQILDGIGTMLSPELLDQLADMAGLSLFLRNAGLVFGGMTLTVLLSLVLICVSIVRFQPLKIFNKQY